MTNLIILTGAGISAESGIQTFRASDGLWEEHRIDDVATPAGFKRDPALVHRFYNERRAKVKEAEPNEGHFALARLEAGWKKGGFLLVTQNIDDLHERAGSKTVLHMHGEINKMRGVHCQHRDTVFGDIEVTTECPRCKSRMRPDIVWFGEMPFHLEKIEPLLDVCDVFLSIGTSGQVMPASLFAKAVDFAAQPYRSPEIIEVNPIPTLNPVFTREIANTATKALPALVDELLAKYQ